MKVIIKNRYKDEITSNVVDKILTKLGLPIDYSIEYVHGDGRNIIITHGEKNIFVIVSRESADSRNAFLAQYVPTVLSQYIAYPSINKKIYVFLLDTTERAKANFILDTYRICKTLGIDIINESDLNISRIQPYTTFQDWKNAKVNRQQYNSTNNSSYAIEDEDGYTLYGKLYGANGKDSSFIACQLANIAKNESKSLKFIPVKEHGTETISQTDETLLNYYGVDTSSGSIILHKKQFEQSTCRKQDEFKFNLLEKYGKKKCYLCDCDIESNIIASHIHRIADIDNSSLSNEEKRKQAVDADNGFWLCANHDKMFEHGIITFDRNGNLIINNKLKDYQISYINNVTNVFRIADNHLTQGLINYLLKHNKRVKLGI